MKRRVVALPVMVMVFLGGIYAWSLFVPILKEVYGFSASQTQMIFGAVITTYTTSMLWADKLINKIGFKGMIFSASVLFFTGYLLASLSGGSFFVILIGIGIFSGVATGFGYMSSISVPVNWFPEKKGIITGFVAGGFAGGSILLTFIGSILLNKGYDVLIVFRYIAFVYGFSMLLIAILLPKSYKSKSIGPLAVKLPKPVILRMFLAILMGTFAGLLVIGNLKLIGYDYYTDMQLSLAIMLFAAANISGRIFWGWLSDKFPIIILLSIALSIQGLATFLIGNFQFHLLVFYLLVLLIGAGFGANFVVFIHETARLFGTKLIAKIYPLIFLGYGIAGIFGPLTGGVLFDLFGNFKMASFISLIVSIMGILVFGTKRPMKQTQLA
jgi:OFA family oxalate/formate antiporter-like MFS transporter